MLEKRRIYLVRVLSGIALSLIFCVFALNLTKLSCNIWLDNQGIEMNVVQDGKFYLAKYIDTEEDLIKVACENVIVPIGVVNGVLSSIIIIMLYFIGVKSYYESTPMHTLWKRLGHNFMKFFTLACVNLDKKGQLTRKYTIHWLDGVMVGTIMLSVSISLVGSSYKVMEPDYLKQVIDQKKTDILLETYLESREREVVDEKGHINICYSLQEDLREQLAAGSTAIDFTKAYVNDEVYELLLEDSYMLYYKK